MSKWPWIGFGREEKMTTNHILCIPVFNFHEKWLFDQSWTLLMVICTLSLYFTDKWYIWGQKMCQTSGSLVHIAYRRPYTWITTKKTKLVLFDSLTVHFDTFSPGTYWIENADPGEHTKIYVEYTYAVLRRLSPRKLTDFLNNMAFCVGLSVVWAYVYTHIVELSSSCRLMGQSG